MSKSPQLYVPSEPLGPRDGVMLGGESCTGILLSVEEPQPAVPTAILIIVSSASALIRVAVCMSP